MEKEIIFVVHDSDKSADEYGEHTPSGFVKKSDVVEVKFKDILLGTIYKGVNSTMWRADLSNAEIVKEDEKANHLTFKHKDLEQLKKDILTDIELIKNVFGLRDGR